MGRIDLILLDGEEMLQPLESPKPLGMTFRDSKGGYRELYRETKGLGI